jgi:hypothetical protein
MATPVFGIEDNDIDGRYKTYKKRRLRPDKTANRREDRKLSCAVGCTISKANRV